MIVTATTAQNDMRIVVIPAKPREEIKQAAKCLKVAAYCRVSTDDKEQKTSYEAQIQYYTDKINKNPEWQMAGIFADEGITGTQAKKRPQFLKMIRLCRQGKIDVILTKSLSRFARNTVDSLNYIRELRTLGIAVISEKENINTLTAESEMLITIMSCFAQAESESISKNVAWGVRQSFKSGNVPIQYAKLLGYKKGENDLPEIIPEEAEIVKEIFRSYLDGMSLKQIADSLNSRGIKTKHKQTTWHSEIVKSILVNEKYTGDALLQKTYITDCITKKSRKNNGELPMYLVKNHHEPIISRADFNRVQEEMARRGAKRAIADKLTKTEQGKYSAKYALSELLVCGECGTHYRRVTWTAKGFKEIKWRCINRIQYGKKKCHNSPTIDEQSLHKTIVSAINEFCEVKDDVAKVLRESITEVLDPNLNGSVQAAQQRIDELAHSIDELIKLATVPETAESALSDIAQFSDEMKTLREFIETEKAKQLTAQRGSDELNAVLERLEKENFTMTEYPKLNIQEGKTMGNMRTMAFQVPEELFQKIKDYLQRNNMTQKQFVIGLIENEIERDLTQRAAMNEAPTDSEEVTEGHAEQQETAAVSDCESVSNEVGEQPEEQESPDFSDDFDSESDESENPDEDEDLDESEDQDESEDMGMSMGM